LIYEECYDGIDSELSISYIGGRKQCNIRDHLIVLYSIMNDVINGGAQEIDVQGVDIVKCFEEMDYFGTHNDFWDVSQKINIFGLVSKLDEKCQVRVKTS
jgi:hypothetical protein